MVEWLAGNRIRGTSAEKPALALPSGSVGGWKEIARVTSNDTDVINIPDKRYLMVLSDHGWNTANAGIGMQINGDTSASQYPRRYSANGGTDATPTTETNIFYDTMGGGTQTGKRWFMVQHIANKSDEKKLIQYNMVFNRSGLGEADAPDIIEGVAKWVNDSDSISRLDLRNFNSGTITSDSEVVVLGWDPTDTHTDNFWEELASVELDSTEDELPSGTFTAKKYLWVQWYVKKTGTANTRWRFNDDDGSNYSSRSHVLNNWAEQTDQTTFFTHADTSGNAFGNMFIINNSANEKLVIPQEVSDTVGRYNGVAKWDNTSSQITSIKLMNTDTGGFQSGTIMKVWGSN